MPIDSHPKSAGQTSALAGRRDQGLEDAETLGQYELFERLGAGGMGTVYRAMHVRLKRPAAIKLLCADRIERRDSLARFLDEMEAIGRLDHPNLVRAYDAGEDNGRHFLVMELIVGADLRKLVDQLGPLRVSDACEVVVQAARGLHHAHQNGLVHRDVKPSNLMITHEGTVKLLDLGIARLAPGDGTEPGHTITDQILGSADYLAPEQGQDPRQADSRSDIYALGCTLYYLLAGNAPFADTKHNTFGRKLLAHATERILDINRLRADLPRGLVQLLRRMLTKRPADRPADMTEVEQTLGAWSTGSDLSALVGRLPQLSRSHSPDPLGVDTPVWTAGSTRYDRPTHGRLAVRWRRQGLRRWFWLAIFTVGIGAIVAALAVGLPRSGTEHGFVSMQDTPAVRLNQSAMIQHPPPLPGVKGWTLETRGGRAAVTHLALSSDQRLLAVGDAVGCVRIVRIGTGDLAWMFVEPNPIRAIAWLPCRQEIAVAAGSLRVWDVETGRLLWEATLGETDAATCLDCSPEGILASGHGNGEIRLWRAGTRELFDVLAGHATTVTSLRFSDNGALVASGDEGSTIRIWSVPDWKPLQQLNGAEPGPIRRLAWSPDATRLASCGGGSHVTIWDRAEGFRPRKESAASQPVSGLGWSSDGQWFFAVSGGKQGMEFAVLWDGDVRKKISRPLMTPNAATAVAWSRNVAVAYCGMSNGELRTYQPGSEETRLFRSAAATRTTTTAWSPIGPLLLVGDSAGWSRLWNLAEGRQVFSVRTSQSQAWVMAWQPGGRQFAVGHTDGSLLVLDAETGKTLKKISCKGHVLDTAFSPCGRWLATAEEHGLCRIWDTATGDEWAQFPLETPSVVSTVAWSPDGHYLAFSAWDARVRLVDVDRRQLVHDWDSGHGCVWHMLWESEGPVLLTSGSYGGIAHWKPADATLLTREEGCLREAGMQGNTLGTARGSCTSRSLRGISQDGTMVVRSVEGSLLALRGVGSSDARLLLCPMRGGRWLAISPSEGFYRADLSRLETLVYVVATSDGQENHTPSEFAATYNWENKPEATGIK